MKHSAPYGSLLCLCLLLPLSGCSSTGTKIPTENLNQIVKGQTTENEVIAMFGKPASVNLSPGSKTLVYAHQSNNNVTRSVATSTASVLGGMAGGVFGSIAGGVVGSNAIASQTDYERLLVQIDTTNNKVTHYEFQQSL